jgi:hypothetical protein
MAHLLLSGGGESYQPGMEKGPPIADGILL